MAGFVLSLLGFTIIGIILSWIGFAQAQREDRPSGLCLAGIVVGFVWIAVGVVFCLAVYSASGA